MEFPYGEIVKKPEDFVPPEQWEEFAAAPGVPSFASAEKVGRNPIGVRWGVWPLIFEEYVSDAEPDLSLSDPNENARNRLVLWRRLSRTDTPSGWRTFPGKTRRVVGFFKLSPNELYVSKWSESARRSLRKWREIEKRGAYRIEPINFDEFEQGFLKSTVDKWVRKSVLTRFKLKYYAGESDNFRIWGVRETSRGEIVSGLGCVDSSTNQASMYYCSFLKKQTENIHSIVGLMDRWFADSKSRNFVYLHFGPSWSPGNPKNWRGFSLFKAKFGLSYICYTQALMRFIRGRFY